MNDISALARLVRYYSIASTTAAGSGHPTTALSATDLMVGLMFGGHFRADLDDPAHPNNDRLVFSKGHAAPLLYALYGAAGKVSEDNLLRLREFGHALEGHPTLAFPYTEAPTGSLGQGLSIGMGLALNAKYIDKVPYNTFVLMGDSEVAEGSVWEAMALASHYGLDNLVGIIDVNRIGQRGQTMLAHDVDTYAKRADAFGWHAIVLDGHDADAVDAAYAEALATTGKPVMLVARTLKGSGASEVADADGWHGKALTEEMMERAVAELGDIDKSARGAVAAPAAATPARPTVTSAEAPKYAKGDLVATRRAYGTSLIRVFEDCPEIVVLDAETGNSTFSEVFEGVYPDRFFEMYIAEQNMVGAAIGLSRRGKTPFVSTFAAFFSRAFDQIRMSQYSDANIKFVGSHAGVSIGEDGASQMGLEDLAMFRTLLGSVVLYPSDAVQADKLIEVAAKHHGNVYIRTTRMDTAVLYDDDEEFPIGGSKTLRSSDADVATLIGCGVTLHQALAAHDDLKADGIATRVIDLYSVKPVDEATLACAATETGLLITVEDHFAEGGIADAVRSGLDGQNAKVHSLAVRKLPRSGKPDELLDLEEISASAIARTVRDLTA
ncbi:transketolase [Candidatus Poribacteria bacterium]|jgi:transketolase|nr:transketolase [Candidatus Poribacteria bacterium]MBT5533794.1 transketolase [Candidatus Poribacteria bacterium]MBT7804089.1 transketolase [Candidatus Poribacteria bacterium]